MTVFISYAREDGTTFAHEVRSRVEPRAGVWMDGDRKPHETFHEFIERALRGSDVVLFVMTPGSVLRSRWCRRELDRADRIDRPVIPLLFDPDAEPPPIHLEGLPPIDLTAGRRRAGWAELTRQLDVMASAEGRIDLLDEQLTAQRRELTAAGPGRRKRLRKSIKHLERRRSGELSRQARLAAGVTAVAGAEAAPEPARPTAPRVRRYGEPRPVTPHEWCNRFVEVEDLERHLLEPGTRLVVLAGPSGHGKSAVVHRLWQRVDDGESPLGPDGLVYLSAQGFWPVSAEHLVTALREVVPKTVPTGSVDELLRRPVQPLDKLLAVLAALDGCSILLTIDAAQDLLDPDLGVRDRELGELLEFLVGDSGHGVRVVLVTREVPRPLVDRFPSSTYVRNLDEGLDEDFAHSLVCALDQDDLLGLRSLPEHDVHRLHRLTGGSPRALELAYGILRAAPTLTFDELLRRMTEAGSDVSAHLFTWAVDQLDIEERKIVQVLAAFGRPVRPTAVNDVLRPPFAPALDSGPLLDDLVARRLVRRDAERYYVPRDPDGVILMDTLRVGTPDDAGADYPDFTRPALYHRAADHLAGERKADPRTLTDLAPQLGEIELRLLGGELHEAYRLILETDNSALLHWGLSGELVPALTELCRQLPAEDSALRLASVIHLARALQAKERPADVVELLERERPLLEERRHARFRVPFQLQLAAAQTELGEHVAAAAGNRRALRAALWSGGGASRRLSHLAWANACVAESLTHAGQFRKALRRWALTELLLRARAVSENPEVVTSFLHLGVAEAHRQLGDDRRADDRLRRLREATDGAAPQALAAGQAAWLEAQLRLDTGDVAAARALAEEAAAIGTRIANRVLCRTAQETLALALLCSGDGALEDAARAAKTAARHHCSVQGWTLLGIIAFRQGDDDAARAAFEAGRAESRRIRPEDQRDFEALDRQGLALGGLAVCGVPGTLDAARADYRAARSLTGRAAGTVRRNRLLLAQFGTRADPAVLSELGAAAAGTS